MQRFLEQVPFFWQESLWQRMTGLHEQRQLPHALLLSGPSGLGKALFANALARYLLCLNPIDSRACSTCSSCRLGWPHPDLNKLSPDEGSRVIKIDQIRSVIDFLQQTSHAGGAKIALITVAHGMNSSAANALLKTLEEPTEGSYLILVSESPLQLPATIRSRCRLLVMSPPEPEAIVDWLRSHISGDGHEDLRRLALVSDACPLRALEMAENGELERRDAVLSKLRQARDGGLGPQALLAQLSGITETAVVEYLLASLTIVIKYLLANRSPQGDGPEVAGLIDSFATKADQKARVQSLLQLHNESLKASRRLRSGSNPNPRLIVEALLWRWCQLPRQP